jgi:sialidase-1
VLLLLALMFTQAEPRSIDLFEAGQGGYSIYRIPTVAVTPKGTILVACEARKTRSDWGEIDLLARRSTDGGKTFEPPFNIAPLEGQFERNPAALKQKLGSPDQRTINNPVLIAGRDGTVHFLYCVEYARVFYRRSTDEGKTWSKAVEITAALEPLRKQYAWQVVATGPGHGLETRKGRLIVPVWLSTGTGRGAHRPSIVSTLASDDGGKTWRAGEIVADGTEPIVDPNESTAAELADGRILLNIRTPAKERRRAFSISKDGLTGWSKPTLDEGLPDPVCMGSLLNVGKTLYFSNLNTTSKRQNLTIKRSDDGGKSWVEHHVVTTGPSAYSDLAASPDGQVLWCFYERGEGKDPYRWLTLLRLPLPQRP